MKVSRLTALKTVLTIGAAVSVIIFVAAHAGLFFGESLLTAVKAKVPLEDKRHLVFFVLIGITVLWAGLWLKAIRSGRKRKEIAVFSSPLRAILSFGLIFLNAMLSFYVIELINNYYLLNMKLPYVVLGWFITFALYLIFVFLLNSLGRGMIAGNIFFLVWALVNFFVQRFRGIPFQWIDFGSAGTALSVSGNYSYALTWQMVACIAVTVAVVALYMYARIGSVFVSLPGKISSRLIGCAVTFAFVFVIFHTSFLANTGIWLRDWQPWYTYRLFGMEAGFFAFAKASYPEAPKGYSAAEVARIQEEGTGGQAAAASVSGELPENIIVIMNESFSDLRVYPNFRTDAELMPGIDALTENTQKGHLLVSVKGGTTANSEYEFLTGNSCVLSPTTVVYNSYIKQDQFSLARILKTQGYRTVALHPYGPHGWNRDAVYPRMGFDEFLHIDNSFKEAEKVRGFVSDRGDYAELIRLVEGKEKGEKLFVFNVTMQNHSAYRNEHFQSTVDVVGFHGENEGQAEQYASLLRLSDEAVMELIDYFSRSSEKTLICFFGDHQPEIGDDFWSYCFGKDLDDLSFAEQQKEFETSWFIWANYDIPEVSDLTLSANYLSSYLMTLTGLKRSGYENYLLGMRDEIPAMNAFGYVNRDGEAVQWTADAENEPLRKYKCLIYNELTGGNARNEAFFSVLPEE